MDNQAKLLIIDDEDIVLDSCTSILASSGYEILTAKDGTHGADLIDEFQPDLVFVDLKMPGISGFEVLEIIKEKDPTIVAIVITGFATINSAVEAMQKGAFDFLPKPFTPDELRLITRRGLEKRKLVLETLALRREKEMLRDHFAAIVSHELKSPLTSIQQYLFSLSGELSDQMTEDQRHRFERIQTRIGDLMNMIRTWLRAITVDVTAIKDSFMPTEIPSVISKAIDITEPQAIRKDITIQVSLQENLPLVNGDEGTLVEAVVNIVGNAVKYSPVGSQIDVSANSKEQQVIIAVEDRGLGISKEDLPLIFEDFFTGKTNRKNDRGSGVGLALTRRIIEAHEGSISVESELGRGSKFKIHLPAILNNNIETTSMTTEIVNIT